MSSSSHSQTMFGCLIITFVLLAHTSQAQFYRSVSSAGVSFSSLPPPQSEGVAVSPTKPHNRRMYAMCPPQFQRVGTDCYSLVQQRSSWLEAHFFCKDKNAILAEPSKHADRKLRTFLQRTDSLAGEHDPIWIGATYDHHNNHWQWSISGRNLSYDAFSQMDPTKPLANNCAVFDPNLKYRWSARSCPDKLRFICQHKMPKVSEANRYKIYNRWNVTYPNSLANEVVLEVIERRGKDRSYHRRVKAEGSAEEMIIPGRKRNGQPNRRFPQRKRQQHQQKAHPNDVNYPHQPQQQQRPGKRQHVSTTTTDAPASLLVNNEIRPTIAGQPATGTTQQQMTSYDRKLQRQREKEVRRQQKKRERQQRMRLDRTERRRKQQKEREEEEQRQRQKQHEREQLQQHEPQSEPEALRQRAIEEQQRQEREQREQLEKQQKQQRREEQERELERVKEQQALQRAADDEALRLREERLQKQREREAEERHAREELLRKQKAEQEEADRRYAEQRIAEEKRMREEYEKRLQEAKSEQERQLQEAHEAKRLEQKAIQDRLEEQERQRQEQIKREEKEEEKRLIIVRLEEARRFEQRELERLKEENNRRELLQRQREAEIAQRQADERKLAEEEERLRQQLQEEEKSRTYQLEHEMLQTAQELKEREDAEQAAAAALAAEKKKKMDEAKAAADARVAIQQEETRRNYASRIAALSPKDRKEFIEMRKKRKQLREKQLKAQEQKKLKRIQEAIRLNEMQ